VSAGLANRSHAAYNLLVPRHLCQAVLGLFALLSPHSFLAQQQSSPASKPQVRINYLNVCTPADPEKQELAAALARIPLKPKFTEDFEISRGRSSANEPPVAIAEAGLPGAMTDSGSTSNWVRVRREFPAESPFISVQYTLSSDGRGAAETLVFRARDTKDILQVLMEAKASAGDPSTVLKTDTPAERIRLERFGKGSVALARCATADQSGYESVFREGSVLLARYRTALQVREIVPGDFRRLGAIKAKMPATGAKSDKAKSTTGASKQ